MRWEIRSPAEVSELNREWLLPVASQNRQAIAIENDGLFLLAGPVAETDPLLLQRDTASPGIALLIYSLADLNHKTAWQEIIASLPPINPVDLAVLQSRLPEIEARIILEATGKRADYRALADWQELARLDVISQDLARRYNFSINTLRLWDRLQTEERQSWLSLWENRKVKKNLIRDIIHDYYDLSVEHRQSVLESALELHQGWGQGVFPSDKLRDIVRTARYPQFEKLRQQVYQLKRSMQLPRQMELVIPDDLEAQRLELKLHFGSMNELESLLESARDSRFRDRLQNLLDLL